MLRIQVWGTQILKYQIANFFENTTQFTLLACFIYNIYIMFGLISIKNKVWTS